MKVLLLIIVAYITSISPTEKFDKKIYNLEYVTPDSIKGYSRTIMPDDWKEVGDSIELPLLTNP